MNRTDLDKINALVCNITALRTLLPGPAPVLKKGETAPEKPVFAVCVFNDNPYLTARWDKVADFPADLLHQWAQREIADITLRLKLLGYEL